MINLIFDTDPGHDDAIAMMMALAYPERVRVLGITTVAGNQTVDKVTENALKLLDYLGMKIPVAKGLASPMCRNAEPQPSAHGESGMDGPNLPPAVSRPADIHAVELLHRLLRDADRKVIIVAIGPLTNLAFFVRMYPELLPKIEKIELMGGSLHSGNILEKAEFNLYHDPEAARIVFGSGVPIVMSGLEICDRTRIAHSAMRKLKNGGKASKLAYDLLAFYCQYSVSRGWDESEIFDMTPMEHILWPELFTSEFYHVSVETEGTFCRGMTVADFRRDRDRALDTTEVLTDVDRETYVARFFESMEKLDRLVS